MDELSKAIDHFSALMEDQNAKLDAVLEVVGDIQRKVNNQPTRDEFNELKDDVRVIKASVTDQSKQLHDHEHRISRLEAA